jgi:hypothetical protein
MAKAEELVLASRNKNLTPEFRQSGLYQELVSKVAYQFAREDKIKDYQYKCPEHWTLVHGKPYQARKKPRGFRFGEKKCCYQNSMLAIIDGRGVPTDREITRYCEGYSLRVMSFSHAWNVDENDEIVDLTLRDPFHREFGTVQYFGVEFNPEWVLKIVNARKAWASVIDNWEHGYPLLKDDSLLEEALIR